MGGAIYFFISYERKEKENSNDIKFVVNEKKNQIPICIYKEESYKNKLYNYTKIFKVKPNEKNNNNYHFEFKINDDKYTISFDSKGKTFIYEVTLEIEEKINQIKIKINQNVMEYYEKMHIFMKALNENKENKNIDILFKDTIDLYSIIKGFDFLIEIFVEIYLKKKLCPILLEKFKEMNENPNDNEKNMDRKPYLKIHTKTFNSIKYDEIVSKYKYKTIEFYGVVLSYLNFYDNEKFSLIINNLSKKKSKKDLYEILLIYHSHLKPPIKLDKKFFNIFIKYIVKNKKFPMFEIGLNYIKDIETFVYSMSENIKEIFGNYYKNNKEKLKCIIKIAENIKIIKSQNIKNDNSKIIYKKEGQNMPKIIKSLQSIIKFSKDNKAFIIYFTNEFWKNILNNYNDPEEENIDICFNLRKIFFEYYELVREIFKDKDKRKFQIKYDAISYFEYDEFAVFLDQIIKKYIEKAKDLSSIEKLAHIIKYNPYYIKKDVDNINTDIFNLFDFNNIDSDFIKYFKEMNFEIIFWKKISDYINKITSKIQKISDFDIAIKLININNIFDKNILLKSLSERYDKIIENRKDLLTDKKSLQNIAKLADINIVYEKDKKKKFNFINDKIRKLDEKIIPKILIEIIRIYINKQNKNNKEKQNFEKIKDMIFEFVNKLDKKDDIDNIMSFIDCLEKVKNEDDIQNDEEEEKEDKNVIDKMKKENEEIIKEFLKKLMKTNLFTKKEFFSVSNSLKILLLYRLEDKGILQKYENEEFYKNIANLMRDIKLEIEGEIRKENLETFLNFDKSTIIQRLGLLNLIFEKLNPIKEYDKLLKENQKINKDIRQLANIKDNIIIYHKEIYKDIIKKLIEIIKENKNIKIKDYKKKEIYDLIVKLKYLEEIVEEVKNVKDFLLFNVIYENMNLGKDEESHFNEALNKLNDIERYLKRTININELYSNYKDIFDIIKEKLINNEERAKKFIDNMINYYGITNQNLIEDLTILFKTKKYEMDINSIIYFFEFFQINNDSWNNKLSKKYKNLSKNNNEDIKIYLNELKENGIYNYKDVENYNKLFTCLFDKKEAIDFLFSKIEQNLNNLYDRIQPTDRIINIKDIKDTEECISEFTKMKRLEDNFKIFDYIKSMNEKIISKFENYSKIYSSIIELDRNDDISGNLYEQVLNIIKDLIIDISQDTEKFLYYDEVEKKYIDKLTFEELIHLKNKIYINNENEKNDFHEDFLKDKFKILNFFKKNISNLEIINEYMKILRVKGSSLPIKIRIKFNMKDKELYIKYYLEEQIHTFEEIRDFLLNAKNKYIDQLNELYKYDLNLRFLYGKQFRSIMKYLENGYNIDSFLRYILDDKNDIRTIKEGDKNIKRNITDYIKKYELYNKNSFDSISAYITSLFIKNGTTLDEHYKEMEMKKFYKKTRSASIVIQHNLKNSTISVNKNYNSCKGIYLQECENISMGKFILNLFWDKLRDLPIAQNILITNKETSPEEIQAFFSRAILCNYNTLFVVELNDSLSEYQQSIMNFYLDSLLSEKYERYKRKAYEEVDKKKTKDYLDSCIAFLYDKRNKNIKSILDEISKFEIQDIPDISYDNRFQSSLDNIRVITSDICGLGKSEKIKKMIKDNKKQYYYFPLGGILTKNIIFDKLANLLNQIKNGNYKDTAIHLDLFESEEISLLNEFFFSFLITKFYSNNESIIYIPKEIYIYIEVPNCFENYLSKFDILNIFKKENITMFNKQPLDFSMEIINIFSKMGKFKSNDDIKKFAEENFKKIGVTKYNYHQINIYIKLFISQFNTFKSKIKFIRVEKEEKLQKEDKKDSIEEYFEEFTNFTKYFINGGLAKLLTGINNNNIREKEYIDLLTEAYCNDLLDAECQSPLGLTTKEKMKCDKSYTPKKDSVEYKDSKNYLKLIKEIFDLPNEVEEDKGKYKSLLSIIEEKNSNYVITIDNFKKIVLLVFRIKANIPVVIMGETGCGKTSLIIKLNQILNNGEKNIEIININPDITDEKLCKEMEEKNKLAKEQKDKELWVFFDEMNTCLSLSLLTEIFINKTYNGKNLSDNIRLIGACNPYRRRKINIKKCRITSISDDNDYSNDKELVYLLQPLPQSLLFYVFSFGFIDKNNEKKYIHSIIKKLFSKDEKILHENTTELISKCHKFLRKNFDSSVVSFREIIRFSKCVEFFQKYFTIKNSYKERENIERNNKLRSIICSIIICYYIRLADDKKRSNFDIKIRIILLKLINEELKIEDKGGDLIEQIKDENLKKEILSRPEETITRFSDFLKIEQEFLLSQIELDKDIGKNSLLKENIFTLFLSAVTNIPLIIIGKPGTGKSLSAQLICKSMKGIYSKNKFFKNFPQIMQTYFQGSESTQQVDVENLFEKAKNKLNYFKNKKLINKELEFPISMILFDRLGFAEKSKNNPLKLIHSKFECSCKEEGVSFVGISNYSLDAMKSNRTLILYVQDLDQRVDDLIETSYNIMESISDKLKNDKICDILSKTYFNYKKELQIIKELMIYKTYIKNKGGNNSVSQTNNEGEIYNNEFEYIKELKEFKYLYKKDNRIRKDFHGVRDFYNLIKGIAIEFGRLGNYSNNKDKIQIIEKYIERNFGGIDYKIDIDLNLKLNDIRNNVELIGDILRNYNGDDNKLTSVFLFKKLYNLEIGKEEHNSILAINKYNINNYNINKCINYNIKDINSRFLLLQIEGSLSTIICQNIRLQNPFKDIIKYDTSPFIDDNNKEYRLKIINQIQDNLKEDKLIILENLNQIHPFLYDLYDMNYIIKDGKRYARICSDDNFNEKLTEVNDKLRIIILVDSKFVEEANLSFLNRFEKIILSFDKLLDNSLKKLASDLRDEMKFDKIIRKYQRINYSLKDLLINCREIEIQGLVYYFSKESKKNDKEKSIINREEIKEKVYDKIYKILPQDIISILPESNIIKKKYINNKDIYNFKDYISQEENEKYKISIIYTFTNITNMVEGLVKEMSFMISEINSENGLKNIIEEIKIKNENNKEYNKICILFKQSNSKKIKFLSNFILKNYFKDKFNYIFIININRNFNEKSQEQNEKIYSLLDINPDINQLFIDNLNANNTIKLNDLFSEDIKAILNNIIIYKKLEDNFNTILHNYLYKNLLKTSLKFDNIAVYIEEILKYIETEQSFKGKIIEITIKLIEENRNEEEESIIEKIYNNKCINIYSIDIASCLIEYIIENIFNKYLKNIFEIMENNNIFTTLVEIQSNKYKYIDKDQIEDIINIYLDEIAIEKNKNYKPKFLFNYNIPGFYNFYIKISNYINKNINLIYFNNEKKLRVLLKEDADIIKDFHEKEESFLIDAYQKIIKNNLFYIEIINKIENDTIFQDYIVYYFQKYKNNEGICKNNNINHKLVKLLIKLRFEDKIIMKDSNKINKLLIKIIWMESNVIYILSILKIFEIALPIFNNNEKEFYNNIEDLIFKGNIKYLSNEKKNKEHINEVNECYYIILASICYSLISDKIKFKKDNELGFYYYYCKLKEINEIIQSLNSNLKLNLKEIYMIDKLIKIIELLDYNITKIDEIKTHIREEAQIFSYINDSDKLSHINNQCDLIKELHKKFEVIYNLILEDELLVKSNTNFYDKLNYIFLKEFTKISDINYRSQIFEKILEKNQMIKKSNNIFQILLKIYLNKNEFKDNRLKILNGDDEILKLLEKKLENDDNFVLKEALLYLFEKNSLIYLKPILNNQNIDGEPLEFLKDCIEFLNNYILKPEKEDSKLKEICKLFCLGYIKTYCYTFIKMLNAKKPNCKEPLKIIEIINGKEPIYKMIRIYIYKILYYNYKIDAFINEESINKYKLKEFKDFDAYIKENELINIYKIDYKVKTLKDEYYDKSYEQIKKYILENFENEINKNDFNIEEYGIDNFYMTSYNLILSDLKKADFVFNIDFFNKICTPLLTELLLIAIKLFFDPKKYNEIKRNFGINQHNITPILYGYRYVLNELSSQKGIYYPIYNKNNINILKKKLYPGNDTESNKVFTYIIEHFKYKPKECCYICLGKNCSYHSAPFGSPEFEELNKKCQKCKRPTEVKKKVFIQRAKTIYNENDMETGKQDIYYRIFKDDEEIEELKKDDLKRDKINNINYMTLKNFKEYIVNSGEFQKKEKGIFKTDKNSFKNNNKIIRNLSQISYRLLNYILYTHLFFARLITDNKKDFDIYLPKGMAWVETLNECWIMLKNELVKEEIYSIEKFMNYIFVDLFPILNKKENINDYKDLIKFENELESLIKNLIKKFKEEINENKKHKENKDDPTSLINLLKEKYDSEYYKKEEYPFYEYFYYTDYLNEAYINKNLEYMDGTKYPVLIKYLQYKNNNKIEQSKYSLDNLNLFNNVLNLFNDKYSNHISREQSEKKILKDDEIYKDNKELIDNFFKFYNSLKLKNSKNEIIILSNENHLGDLFIDNKTDIGRTYKDIYKNFIKEQNEKIEDLLENKIEKGIFTKNCKNKVNIQQINEREIFAFNLPNNISFIDILFNASYRKILDSETRNYESYREYEIDYDLIEENMTDLLLKNKKLLKDDIYEFNYNNEIFSNEVTNIITSFKTRYNCKTTNISDKVAIYKFSIENKGNTQLYKNIINDFITLIKFLNNERKEGNNKDNGIKEDTKIYEVLDKIKGKISDNFMKIFENNNGFTINKACDIFEYYLKSIYEDVNKEIKCYQKNLDDKSIKLINDLINKKDIACALRLFITLVLFPEEDKENKIKSNLDNVVNYLNAPDLWNKDIYEDIDFYKNLKQLKSINVPINQIVSLYEYLGKDIDNYFFDDVKNIIEEENNKDNEIVDDDDNDANHFINKGNDEEDDPFKNEREDEN